MPQPYEVEEELQSKIANLHARLQTKQDNWGHNDTEGEGSDINDVMSSGAKRFTQWIDQYRMLTPSQKAGQLRHALQENGRDPELATSTYHLPAPEYLYSDRTQVQLPVPHPNEEVCVPADLESPAGRKREGSSTDRSREDCCTVRPCSATEGRARLFCTGGRRGGDTWR